MIITQIKLSNEIITRAMTANKIKVASIINTGNPRKAITLYYADLLPQITYIVSGDFYNNFLKSTLENNGKN